MCLGRGGYASVWLAWRQGPMGVQIPVAVKVLQREHAVSKAARRRFWAEARLLVALDHPHIIQIHDTGDADKLPFYVMEYVRGTSLAQLLNVRRGLPVDAVLQIGVHIASALSAAHKARDGRGRHMRIVHRDVNPSNILLGRHGNIKLIDFGIATSEITPRNTRINVIKGNPRYLAPEQALGLECDVRTDVYGLGLTLYEAITGVAPLATDSLADPLVVAREPRIVRPSVHRPTIGDDLDRVLMRALRRDPAHRFPAMEPFLRSLHGCLMDVNTSQLFDSLDTLVGGADSPEIPTEQGTRIVKGNDTVADYEDEAPTQVYFRDTHPAEKYGPLETPQPKSVGWPRHDELAPTLDESRPPHRILKRRR